MENMPPKLYKYRDCDNDNHRRILTHNEIYFTSAKKFNDPFDGTVPIRFEIGSIEQITQKAKKLAKDNFPLLNREQRREEVRKAVKRLTDPQDIERRKSIQRKHVYNDYGIFSVSEDPINILMWSHYSCYHTGFCVGFDMSCFERMINREDFYSKDLIDLRKIEYRNKYPVINPYIDDSHDINAKMMIYKSAYWSYENEYRLILMGNTNSSINIDPNVICEVILGCKISHENEEQIIEELMKRENHPRLFKAKMKDYEYGLDLKPVDY